MHGLSKTRITWANILQLSSTKAKFEDFIFLIFVSTDVSMNFIMPQVYLVITLFGKGQITQDLLLIYFGQHTLSNQC